MRIGVFVGSFNPVHEGHIKIVNHLLDKNYLDKILLLATPNYWDKQDLISVEHRINMLKFYETDKIIVDDIHNNFPYTYQVLRSLKKDYKDELYLIIGADNIVNLDKWKNIDELLKYKIIILNRDNIDINKYLDKYPNKENFIVVDDYVPLDVSSTKIRNGDYKYLDSKVKDYIENNKLYWKK